LNLDPPWIGDLLGLWVSRERHSPAAELGWPTVSPSFAGMAEATEAEEVTGYSLAELAALSDALEWLAAKHPVEYAALNVFFRPSLIQRSRLGVRSARDALAGGRLLADYIDRKLR